MVMTKMIVMVIGWRQSLTMMMVVAADAGVFPKYPESLFEGPFSFSHQACFWQPSTYVWPVFPFSWKRRIGSSNCPLLTELLTRLRYRDPLDLLQFLRGVLHEAPVKKRRNGLLYRLIQFKQIKCSLHHFTVWLDQHVVSCFQGIDQFTLLT